MFFPSVRSSIYIYVSSMYLNTTHPRMYSTVPESTEYCTVSTRESYIRKQELPINTHQSHLHTLTSANAVFNANVASRSNVFHHHREDSGTDASSLDSDGGMHTATPTPGSWLYTKNTLGSSNEALMASTKCLSGVAETSERWPSRHGEPR